MESFQIVELLVFLQFISYGQTNPGFSFASSIGISGQPPQTYTYQSGPGIAMGYAGSTQPNGTYIYTTSVSRPRYRRQLSSRNDASQQRQQQAAPPGFAPPEIDIQRVPPPEVIFVKQTPPPAITFGKEAILTSRDYQNDEIVRLLSKPYTAYVDQELQEDSRRGTPAEVYGPPADDNSGGGDISSHSLGNKFRKPHEVYGPPGLTTFTFNTPDDSSSQDNINGQYIFVSAFPDSDQVIDNIPFAPPGPEGGFQPPDGALLSPPAPVVNNIPLPSPRKPEKSKFYFKLYPTLS